MTSQQWPAVQQKSMTFQFSIHKVTTVCIVEAHQTWSVQLCLEPELWWAESNKIIQFCDFSEPYLLHLISFMTRLSIFIILGYKWIPSYCITLVLHCVMSEQCIGLLPLTSAVAVNSPFSTRQQSEAIRQMHYILFLNMTTPP